MVARAMSRIAVLRLLNTRRIAMKRTRTDRAIYRHLQSPISKLRQKLRLETLEGRVLPTTFAVINTNDSGAGSLRQAIMDANGQSGTNTISFNIPGNGVHVIQPYSPLPAVTHPVKIDGSTQHGYFKEFPQIVIKGANAGNNADGLTITSGGTTILGVVINGFSGNGITIQSDGNTIADDFIGTDATASSAVGNNYGVWIVGSNNTIGTGRFYTDFTVISGNNADGIHIDSGSGNLVHDCFVGLDWQGNYAIPNQGNGVYIGGSSNNLGLTANDNFNYISGNGAAGVVIAGNNNDVHDSGIGFGHNNMAIGNFDGVYITGNGNILGGHNGGGNQTRYNVISGNLNNGVYISGNNNFVQSDQIGTAPPDHLSALPNYNGVYIDGGSDNTIGGPTGWDDIISGNINYGVYISGQRNLVQGCGIGPDDLYHGGIGNGYGIYINGGSNNTIGGASPGLDNAITTSTYYGIYISNSNNNLIQNNQIGQISRVGIGGSIPGNHDGVYIDSGSGNIIGGTSQSNYNVIDGNGNYGVYVGGDSNTVQGNTIGIGPNNSPWGNTYGIYVDGNNNTIGGRYTAYLGNIVSGNTLDGIYVAGNGNQVIGNVIGFDDSWSHPLPNGNNGVTVTGFNNTIGGSVNNNNIIGYNGHDGVQVDTGTGNSVRFNSIANHNQGLGIELTNGGNYLQPAPLIASAIDNGDLTVIGSLIAAPNTTYALDFYSDMSPNPSGFGEGQSWVYATYVTTNSVGVANFTISGQFYIPPGQYIAATATDPGNNTSAFSNVMLVIGSGSPQFGLNALASLAASSAGTAEAMLTTPGIQAGLPPGLSAGTTDLYFSKTDASPPTTTEIWIPQLPLADMPKPSSSGIIDIPPQPPEGDLIN
jgi:hypothetical protein